jgi:hypothetical protein
MANRNDRSQSSVVILRAGWNPGLTEERWEIFLPIVIRVIKFLSLTGYLFGVFLIEKLRVQPMYMFEWAETTIKKLEFMDNRRRSSPC